MYDLLNHTQTFAIMMRSACRDEIRVAGVYITLERMEGARCEAMKGFWDTDVCENVSGEEALRHLVRTVLGARQKYALHVHDVTTCVWVAARYSWPDWRASAE